MSDVCVTLPQSFGMEEWVAEGQLPGEEDNGLEYFFYLGGHPPRINPGERVYVCYKGRLRGYAPLVRIERFGRNRYALVRAGGAAAVTIPEHIRGFQGFRYRWWSREDEQPFPEWQQE